MDLPVRRLLALSAIAIAAAGTLAGQQTAASTDSGNPQGIPMVDWSPAEKLPKWLQLGGQIRGRVENPSGTSLLNSASDTYYLSRLRFDLGVRPTKWLRFFIQTQDARVAGYNSNPAPSSVYNPLDIRQAYVALDFKGKTSVGVKAGRQQMAFGGERLIGPSEWNMSHTFDTVEVSVSRGRARVDLMGGAEVLVDFSRLDRHKPGEHFYGAYGSIKEVLPYLNVEPYVLFKQTRKIKSEDGTLGDSLVTSPGGRVYGKTGSGLDYVVELVVQRGSYSSDRVTAFAQSYVAGWTFGKSALKPRLSAEYSYASGDSRTKDGSRGTFDQFYPSNHSNNGMLDQFGWKNLKNLRTGFDGQAARKLKFRVDFDEFYLATTQDALYASSSSATVLNRAATSGHIGWELNGIALYEWSKIWKFGAGYGRLWAGDFLKQSKVGAGYRYPYLMFVGTF